MNIGQVKSNQIIWLFFSRFLLCHPAASRIKKQHLRDGADFIPAFLASNYSDIRLQAGRLRLKFRYKNNFAVATSIAQSDRFNRSQVTFPLILARKMNIILLLRLLVVIGTIILIVTTVGLSIIQPRIKEYNIINLLKL